MSPVSGARAGVPDEVALATKPMIALQLVREALADGVAQHRCWGTRSFSCKSMRPSTGAGALRPRPNSAGPSASNGGGPTFTNLVEIAATIPATQWQSASWKTAQGEQGTTRLAWCEVWLQHALRKAGGELEKFWLVVDWPADGTTPYHYYLAHLHRPPTNARCATLSRSRWHIEQYFQRAKG